MFNTVDPKKTTEIVVLGIDPGFDRVGWSICTKKNNKFTCLALGHIQTDKKQTLLIRYQKIIADLQEIIAYFKPQQVAIETLYFSNNKKTALKVSGARGVIISVFLNNNLEVYEYDPNTIKLAVTGNGRADKTEVKKMIILQLENSINQQIDDAIDAVAIAMTHIFTKVIY